jgi:hypothetical protein
LTIWVEVQIRFYIPLGHLYRAVNTLECSVDKQRILSPLSNMLINDGKCPMCVETGGIVPFRLKLRLRTACAAVGADVEVQVEGRDIVRVAICVLEIILRAAVVTIKRIL